jgi:hypothetical protein
MKRPYLNEIDRLSIRLGTSAGSGLMLHLRLKQLQKAIAKELGFTPASKKDDKVLNQ